MNYRWLAGLSAALVLCTSAAAADIPAPGPLSQPAAARRAEEVKTPGGAPEAADVKKAALPDEAAKSLAEPLRSIDGAPLSDMDFAAAGLSLGDDPARAAALFGAPARILPSAVKTEYEWPALAVRAVNDLPQRYMNRTDLDLPGRGTAPGINVIYLKGQGIKTARGIAVGSRRENVVRVYGRPVRLLWDGPAGSFYAVYEKDGKMLVFTIEKGKVAGIRISTADPSFAGAALKKGEGLSDEDLRIAGYGLGGAFREYSWLVWEKKAVNPEEEVWYYPGFGARMDSAHKILSALFITDGRMMTWRGVSAGDQMSTVEALYGAPQKVEMTEMEGHPQTAYIYFSKDRKTVLIFYIDEAEKVVRHIMVMHNPQIRSPFQPALDRIRQIRERDQAGAAE